MSILESLHYPWLATALSALSAFILGMFWYHPKILGENWMEARGLNPSGGKPGARTFIYTLLLWLLSACFYSFLVQLLDIDTIQAFLCVSCLLWVAFAMPPIAMGALYTNTSFKAVAIDAGYQLAGYYLFAVMHIVVAMWSAHLRF